MFFIRLHGHRYAAVEYAVSILEIHTLLCLWQYQNRAIDTQIVALVVLRDIFSFILSL